MADKRAIRRAYEAALAEAFERHDPNGVWVWRPSAFEAFRLGYEAAERKHKNKEPTP